MMNDIPLTSGAIFDILMANSIWMAFIRLEQSDDKDK